MAHTLYKIFYGNTLVYLGRTNQPLQNRLRGHFFKKPMHRCIDIELVTRIEYAEFETQADMNLYEIYYILTLKPPLNVDDKTKDFPTVTLPDVEWHEFTTHLMPKWLDEIRRQKEICHKNRASMRELNEKRAVIRSKYRMGEITEEQRETELAAVEAERKRLLDESRRYGGWLI